MSDSGILAAKGALRIAPQLEFAELHIERVEQEQAVEERSALAEDELQRLGRLDEPDHPRQHTKHAALGAARDGTRRGRLGIKTAIARPAQVRRKQAGLPLKSENGAIHVRLPEQHAGVVGRSGLPQNEAALVVIGFHVHRIRLAVGVVDADRGYRERLCRPRGRSQNANDTIPPIAARTGLRNSVIIFSLQVQIVSDQTSGVAGKNVLDVAAVQAQLLARPDGGPTGPHTCTSV